MLNFETKPYVFSIDGKEYTLPRFDFGRFEKVFDIMELDAKEQTTAFRDLVLSDAPAETEKILNKLQPNEIVALFRDWSQLGTQKKEDVPLGEDSSSTN